MMKSFFIINNVIVHANVAHLLEWSTSLSMFGPTTRNGSTMEPKFLLLDKNFSLLLWKVIDKKYLQHGHVATATWPCWGKIEGLNLDAGVQKGPSIYLNNTTRGEIFDPQKPRWGGGLKMKRGPGTFSRPGRKGRKGGFWWPAKMGFWRVLAWFFKVFKGFWPK
jgi:hypothetical protein